MPPHPHVEDEPTFDFFGGHCEGRVRNAADHFWRAGIPNRYAMDVVAAVQEERENGQ